VPSGFSAGRISFCILINSFALPALMQKQLSKKITAAAPAFRNYSFIDFIFNIDETRLLSAGNPENSI
jgi:hypothetical protein